MAPKGNRYNPLGRKGVKLLTYGQAEAKAKKLLGPDAAVRFIRAPTVGPKGKRQCKYLVGLLFDDTVGGKPARLFGVVGDGNSWRLALTDAATNMRKAVREARKAEEAR